MGNNLYLYTFFISACSNEPLCSNVQSDAQQNDEDITKYGTAADAEAGLIKSD